MSSQTFENRSESIIEQDTVACRTSRWLTKGRDGSDEAKYWTGHLKFYPLASVLTVGGIFTSSFLPTLLLCVVPYRSFVGVFLDVLEYNRHPEDIHLLQLTVHLRTRNTISRLWEVARWDWLWLVHSVRLRDNQSHCVVY